MDSLTAIERSERMSRIRSKDTKPELIVRRIAHGLGYRYRLHKKGLAGKPDLVFSVRRKIVFVHGCFWHAHEGCNVANRPKSRTQFWDEKFARNKARDESNLSQLRQAGWKVLTIWECETKNPIQVAARLSKFLGRAKMSLKMKGSRNGGH